MTWQLWTLCILTFLGLLYGAYRLILWIDRQRIQRICGQGLEKYRGSTNGWRVKQ